MNAGCAGKTVKSLENACHTWAPWGAIQIHVYLYLTYLTRNCGPGADRHYSIHLTFGSYTWYM